MTWNTADFDRIATLDAEFAFLEEPERSLSIDQAAAPGPLIGVKSNIRVAGQAWTAGIGARRDAVAQSDADVIAPLRAAGAAFLARLNMDEAALGATGVNPHFAKTRNPARPGFSPGGSSSGSAAAVAAGACDIALGTDTLGSVRIPAAYCNLFGLKAGAGALPMEGVFPLSPSLDTLGFLARDTSAIETALDHLGIQHRERSTDAFTLLAIDEAVYDSALGRTLDRTEAALGACGAQVSRTKPEFCFSRIRSDAFLRTEIEGAQALAGQDGLSDSVADMLAYGAHLSADKRARVDAHLSVAAKEIAALVEDSGIFVLPTVAAGAFRVGSNPPPGQADFTAIANVAGLPALSFPFPGSGVSLQLVGRKGSERSLLYAARHITAALTS